jgi:hypothetical protein
MTFKLALASASMLRPAFGVARVSGTFARAPLAAFTRTYGETTLLMLTGKRVSNGLCFDYTSSRWHTDDHSIIDIK